MNYKKKYNQLLVLYEILHKQNTKLINNIDKLECDLDTMGIENNVLTMQYIKNENIRLKQARNIRTLRNKVRNSKAITINLNS